MKNSEYKAVDCSFHDLIEAAIVMRTIGPISYLNDDSQEVALERVKVLDWVNRNKEEFVILSDNTEIRMDKISFFMGKEVINGTCAI